MNKPERSLCPFCLRKYSLETYLLHPCIRRRSRTLGSKPDEAQSIADARRIDEFYRRVTK